MRRYQIPVTGKTFSDLARFESERKHNPWRLDRPLVPSWDKLKCIVTDLSIERTPSSGLLLGLSLALRFHLLAIDRLKEAFEYSVICHLEQAELGGELTDVAIDLF